MKLAITLTVSNVNAACAPLTGYAVYLWHCDRTGNYSLYGTAAGESYLRGVRVTDANGQVTFTTIFPACYDGRWPHMHFEVFFTLSNVLSGRYAVLTSQLAMPVATCAAVYADTTTYAGSADPGYTAIALFGIARQGFTRCVAPPLSPRCRGRHPSVRPPPLGGTGPARLRQRPWPT